MRSFGMALKPTFKAMDYNRLDTIPGAPGSSKPRYALLDGLRGVAALLVVWSHFFEAFATSPQDMVMNHYYLAVDFFFILSGFVIGYAYDSRWSEGMTKWQFVKRRIIRLHPMVVLGVVLGAIAWLVQGSVRWDGTAMPLHSLMVCLVLGLFLIPVLPGSMADVRATMRCIRSTARHGRCSLSISAVSCMRLCSTALAARLWRLWWLCRAAAWRMRRSAT